MIYKSCQTLTLILICAGSVQAQNQQGNTIYELDDPVAILGLPEKNALLYEVRDFVGGNQDTVYVMDYGDRLIYAFDYEGNILFKFGGQGQGPGEFLEPREIEFSHGTVFVSDNLLNRIACFTSDGLFIRFIGLNSRPTDFTASADKVYLSQRWYRGPPVIEVPISDSFDSVPLFQDAEQFFPKVDEQDWTTWGDRMARIHLFFDDDVLVAAFSGIGVVASLPTHMVNPTPIWITLDSPIIGEYLNRFIQRKRAYEGPGSISPTIFTNVAPWYDHQFACHIYTKDREEYTDMIAVLFDYRTGKEVGMVKVSNPNIGFPKTIGTQFIGAIDFENVAVILYKRH